MTNKDCLFCRIANGKTKAEVLLENDKAMAFADVNPSAEVHVLVIPKKHIDSVLTIKKEDGEVLVAMYDAAKRVVEEKGLDAFRLAFNGGKFQHVPHLHMHLLSGGKILWNKL